MSDDQPFTPAVTPEEFAAERRRAMLAAGCPERTEEAEPVTMEHVSDASRGGCILGALLTLCIVVLFVCAFVLGRLTAPDPPPDRTRAAVCELLDQLGADDPDGHVRAFCP